MVVPLLSASAPSAPAGPSADAVESPAAACDAGLTPSSVKVSEDVFVVSYLSEGGYTLTVALNFSDGTVVGFASNESDWTQQAGTFEVLDSRVRTTGRPGANRPATKPK